ncbi:unnamed protein product [Gordionus sp. m RMFG-2023]
MSYRYRDFSKLMQKWPLDISKSETNRDLGAYIRQKIKEAYKQGQYNHISNQKLCDNIFKNLSDIADDKYLKLYPRNKSLIGSTACSVVNPRSIADSRKLESTRGRIVL